MPFLHSVYISSEILLSVFKFVSFLHFIFKILNNIQIAFYICCFTYDLNIQMSPGSKESVVWIFFKKTLDRQFATCTICNKQLRYFTSTTNLMQHLLRKHRAEYLKEAEVPSENENEDASLNICRPTSLITNISTSTESLASTSTSMISSSAPSRRASSEFTEDIGKNTGAVSKPTRTR